MLFVYRLGYIVAAATSRIPSYSEAEGMQLIRTMANYARHLHKKKTMKSVNGTSANDSEPVESSMDNGAPKSRGDTGLPTFEASDENQAYQTSEKEAEHGESFTGYTSPKPEKDNILPTFESSEDGHQHINS